MTKTITTPQCFLCGQAGSLALTPEAYKGYIMYQRGGVFVQDALPMLTAAQREQVKTGTHPACWDNMFSGFEE